MRKRLCLLSLLVSSSFLFADASLDRLLAGNDRYVKDQSEHPDHRKERKEAMVSKQTPFAVIVGCSDSRVPPEIVFDQWVGDLFVVRVAGNVIGPVELSSIEFAVRDLGASIVLVMGHSSCGAVQAVVDGKVAKIEPIAEIIEPSVEKARANPGKDLLDTSIKNNALRMKEVLLKSPTIKKQMDAKKVEIRAACYDLATGKVDLLD